MVVDMEKEFLWPNIKIDDCTQFYKFWLCQPNTRHFFHSHNYYTHVEPVRWWINSGIRAHRTHS